jgi:hypothetical protein
MFLRSEDLPTWPLVHAGVIAKMAGEGFVRIAVAAEYLSSFTPKALAIDPNKGLMYWMSDTRGLDSARNAALAACKKAGGTACRIVMENFDVVPAAPGVTAKVDVRSDD